MLTGKPVSQTFGHRASMMCFSLLKCLSGRMPSLVILESEIRCSPSRPASRRKVRQARRQTSDAHAFTVGGYFAIYDAEVISKESFRKETYFALLPGHEHPHH